MVSSSSFIRITTIFNEEIFIKAITERTEDARVLRSVFRPEWLNNAIYRPILQEIFNFLDREKIPPSIQTLHQIFKDKDEMMYGARYKKTLDELNKVQYDLSSVIYNITRAKDVAISRSFKDLFSSAYVETLFEEDQGPEILKEFEKWRMQFFTQSDEVEGDLKTLIESIVREQGFVKKREPIPCGIKIFDQFAGGGIKTKNLAIILAPSKNGKSVALMNIAYHIAAVEERNVLFITNELTTEETAERFAARITGISSSEIQKDMSVVLGNSHLERHWSLGFNKRLRILEKISEFNSDFIESSISKYVSLYSWKPEVIVIDYLERMRPTVKDVARGETWNWVGAIARDLVRLGKKQDALVWTASQTNRSGFNQGVQLGAGAAQGSIKHLQEASFVVGMRKRKTGQGTVFELEPIMTRHSGDAERVFVKARTDKMMIGDEIVNLSAMDFLDIEEQTWGKKKKKTED